MPATDLHAGATEGVMAPADNAVAVTKHDTTELTYVSRGIYVGGAGDMTVLTLGGETTQFVGIAAGTLLPIRVRRVNSTGTTVTAIVALY